MYRDKTVVVVMPAYNAGETLRRTYEEVRSQDYVDQIILVDDASSDPTVEIAEGLPESTPAAAIANGTRPDQEVVISTLGEIAAAESTGWEFVELFETRHDGPFRFPAREIAGGRFFAPAELRQWIASRPGDFAEGFLECFEIWSARD